MEVISLNKIQEILNDIERGIHIPYPSILGGNEERKLVFTEINTNVNDIEQESKELEKVGLGFRNLELSINLFYLADSKKITSDILTFIKNADKKYWLFENGFSPEQYCKNSEKIKKVEKVKKELYRYDLERLKSVVFNKIEKTINKIEKLCTILESNVEKLKQFESCYLYEELNEDMINKLKEKIFVQLGYIKKDVDLINNYTNNFMKGINNMINDSYYYYANLSVKGDNISQIKNIEDSNRIETLKYFLGILFYCSPEIKQNSIDELERIEAEELRLQEEMREAERKRHEEYLKKQKGR